VKTLNDRGGQAFQVAMLPSVVIEVAVPIPLRQCFDFLPPLQDSSDIAIGSRVKVTFANRKLIGVVLNLKKHSDVPIKKLKPIIEVLDQETIFEPAVWETLNWLSHYYLAPIGEVFALSLPTKIRQGDNVKPKAQKAWVLSEYGQSADVESLLRAPLQLAIIKRLRTQEVLTGVDFKNQSSGWRGAIDALTKKGWLACVESEPKLANNDDLVSAKSVVLNEQQKAAVLRLKALSQKNTFVCALLHGVTGSGKTEVYFELMQQVLENGKQVLLLVPEIGLTPQLVTRIKTYFKIPVITMHSGLNSTERQLAWWHARQGNAKIILGTRSAVFTSCADLGLIVVDEEHDASFKQQDGVRYHARDVAVYRAKQHNIPIVLGSATPSLESFSNAKSGRYELISLTQRATKVAMPSIELLDLNKAPTSDGLSQSMLNAIEKTYEAGKQSILFLNRRGYAPVLFCGDCRRTLTCSRCDANLTVHRRANRVRCHHCGYDGMLPKQCRHCFSQELVEVGEGTQRVEEAISRHFPNARVLRIDRDSTRRKGELDAVLEQARNGEADILLGTQLLTKGHDFPNVALVGVLNADQGLYSTDFRASESLFQQILQVAGRAGRREQTGQVLIQTSFPEHPFFEYLCAHNFNAFAEQALTERQTVNYPPYGYFALLQSESTHQAKLSSSVRWNLDVDPLNLF